ncbi:hypothetical protein EMPS_05865 [Entomortierella parvispora]|uniref:Enoyl reductase (ER) domain-containing protein n=1 Tax=Entomortierella parvispora TaxID=205924 RepID=A0A9P3LWW8_9FUNG|nr:hypothetical protein EMPS_05865 [Entomortierella parvispora]
MVTTSNKTVVFRKTPSEYPVAGEHLDVETRELVTDLKENEVLTRNLFLSADPYLRGRMRPSPSYIPGYVIGSPLDSYGVAEVVSSKNPAYPVGTIIYGTVRWEEYSVISADRISSFEILPKARELASRIPLSNYVGVAGMPGQTAYSSLKAVAKPKAGETIYISAASGAVGQLVGQLAKLQGLRVVGSAGSDAKVEYLLKELKFDAAFNYKNGSVLESLREAAPEGIDIYYDNVGAEHLEAALEVLNKYGRVVACGQIADYNTKTPYGVKNLMYIVAKSLRVEGFLVTDYTRERKDFLNEISQSILNGDIIYKEDITDGLDKAPEALIGIFHGKNFGKAVIKIADL